METPQLIQAKQQIELAKPDFERNVQEMELNLNFQKEASFALQLFQANNSLAGTNPESIKNAIVNVSLTGLTLNPVLKLAYLVPRKGKCCLDPSYMGLIKILTDTGSVKNIESKVVYSNEPFEIQQGTNPYVKHGISMTPNKGDIVGVYSIATLNDGSTSVEWMYKADIDAIASRSESVKKGNASPWFTDYHEMARKTVVKRHYKYLPKSERGILAANAIDVDHETNGIDFEKEKRDTTINIDVLEPTPDVLAKFQQMYEGIRNPIVPDNAFNGQAKEQFIESFDQELRSGAMPIEKADGVYNYVLGFFKNPNQQQ